MIRFEKVCFSYPGKEIFRDLSLEFPQTGAIALMGPSGLGKTTLLRLLAGLQKPMTGKIIGTEQMKIAFLFQEDRLLPWLTAEKNVALASNEEKAAYWLREVEIENAAQYPREMSGGMQRRVALARAMAYEGDILLLDEPFKGLDETLRARIAHRIQGKAPLTVLSIHDRAEAALMDAEIWELDKLMIR